uniref:Con-Ins Q1b n=1 Tax=Conus quercinus TaxID=101313 RepID=INS1B_CONQU|nr:RecName: Full=Con-Ins Q1b; AltName: Full=Insulin 1b; Contains: RecName: Full=Con-Ins Q1b B chain; Contains: RecName: Full=Con-Ins Q1b A chain; Flags: Precursor [Conus quercinus]AJD85831.1 insulin 1b precursor [Conus quercinus]
MTTSSYFLLVALGLLLYLCQSSFGTEHTCEPGASPHPQGKCGPELAEFHETMCEVEESLQGGTDDARKKRGRASLLRKRRGFLSMLKARAKRNEASPLPRAGRGIVCECCKNSCTYEEITEYCPPVTEGSG